MAAVYIVLIVGDFKKIRLKAFLCITFFALRWLAVGSVSQLMMLINQMTTTLMNNIEIYMTNIPAIIAMFVATEILEVVLCMLFIGFSVKMFLKVYKNVCEELTVKEFIMLVLPMLAQVVGYHMVLFLYFLCCIRNLRKCRRIIRNRRFLRHRLITLRITLILQ